MKKLLVIAAAPIAMLLLSGPVQAASDVPAAQGQSGATLYCWKGRLYEAGNDLVCNWTENAKDACEESKMTNIGKDAVVSEPAKAKRCENGEWLVRVTKK
ncbi:MAG: hypothetical protein HY255_05140 [Betaproteobacteria bacterium]|nr:hypothetical protein [Betaproteobacteria bacterium]